jgi:hypothetical protein
MILAKWRFRCETPNMPMLIHKKRGNPNGLPLSIIGYDIS